MSDFKKFVIGLSLSEKDLQNIEQRMQKTMENGMSLDRSGKAVVKKDMETLLGYVRELTSGISNSTPDIAEKLIGNLKNVLPMISGLADKMRQVNDSTDWMKQGFTFGDDIYTTIKALDTVQQEVADVRAEVSELTTSLKPFLNALKANDPSKFFKKYGDGFQSVSSDASTMRATITKELKAIESSGSGLKNLMKDVRAASRDFVDVKSAEEALNIFNSLQGKLEIYEDFVGSFGKGKAIEHDIEEVKDYAKALVELQNLSKNKFASNLFDVKGSTTMRTGDIQAWLQEIKQSIDATVKQAGDTLQKTVDGLNLKEVQLSVVLPEADAKKIEQQANAWVDKFNEKFKTKPIQLSVDMADPFKTYKAKTGQLPDYQQKLADDAKTEALKSLRGIANDETLEANFSGLDDPETSRILRKLAESFVKIRKGVELGQQSIADATKQWRTEMEKMLTLEFKFDTKSKLDPERIDALLEEVQEIFRNHSINLNPNTELLVKDIEDAIKGKVFDIAINPKINGTITMPVSGVQWVSTSGQSTTPPKSTPPVSTPPTTPPTSQNASVPHAVENVVRSAEQSAQTNQETVVKANALTDALTKLTDDIATARTRHQGVQDIKDTKLGTIDNTDKLIDDYNKRIKTLQAQQANLRNSLIPTQKDLEQYGSLENFNNAIRDRIESVKRQVEDVDAEIKNVDRQIENIKSLTPKGEIETLAVERRKIRAAIPEKEKKLIPTAEQIAEAGSKDKWEEANAEEIKKLTEEIADLRAREKAISEKIVQLRNEEAKAFEDSLATDKRRKGAIEKVLKNDLDYKKLIVDNVNKFYAANDKRFKDLLPGTQQFDQVLGGKYNLGKQYGELIKAEQELSKFDPNRSEEKTAELQAKVQKIREEISEVVATVKTAVAKELQKLHVDLDATKEKLKTNGVKSLSVSEKRALQLSDGMDNIRYLENNFTKRHLFEQLGFKNLKGVNSTASLKFVEEILKSSTTLSSSLGSLKVGDVKLSGTAIDDLKYFIPIVQETMGIVAQSAKEWEKTDALKQRFLGILDLARVISELYKIVPSDENGNIEAAIERFKHIFANVSTGAEDITKTIEVADAYLTKSKALSEMTGANAVYKAVVDNADAKNHPLLRMIQNTWSALPSGIKDKMKPYTGAIDIGALKDNNISAEILTSIRDSFVAMFKSGVLDSEVFTKLREGSPELQKFYDALQLNTRYLEKTAAEEVLKTTLFGKKRRTDDVGNIVQQKETGVIDKFQQAMNGNQPMAVTIVGENGQTLSYGYQSKYSKSKMDVDGTFSFGSRYAFEKFGIDELIAERNALQDGIIAEKLALESSIKYLEGSEEDDDQALLEKQRARLATIEEIMASETKMADYQASIAARLKAIDEEILSRFTLAEGKDAPKRTIRKDYAYENHPWVQAKARKANYEQLLAELDKTNEVNQDVLTKRVEKEERELQRKLTEDEVSTIRQDIAQKQRQELIERIKQEDAIIKDENQMLDALRTLRDDVDIARKKYEDASGRASAAKGQVKHGFQQINSKTGKIGSDYKQYKNHHIQTDLPPLTLEEAVVDKDGVISYKNSWGRFRDKLNMALQQHTMNPEVVKDLIAEIDTASAALEELMSMGGDAMLMPDQLKDKDELRATIAKARQNIIDKYYEQEYWVVTNLIAETEETLRSQHDSVSSSAHGHTADINKKYDELEQQAKDEHDRRVAEINAKYADKIILGTGEQEVIAEYNSRLQETRSEIRRARLDALDGAKRQELASIAKQYQTEVSAISNQYTKGTDEYNQSKVIAYRNWAKAEIQVENKYKELVAKIDDEIKNANPNRLAELQSARDTANMQTVDGEIDRLKAKAVKNAKARLDKLMQPTQSRVDATYTPLLQRVDTYTRGMSPSGVDGWKTAREIAINKVIDGEVLRLQEELRAQSVERLTTLASTLGADSSEYKDAVAIEKSELQKQLDAINKSAILAQFEREQKAYNEAVSAHNKFVMSDSYRQAESDENERLQRELRRISSTRRRNTVTTQVEQAKIDTQQAFDDFIRQLASEYQIQLRSGSGDVIKGDKTAMQTELDEAARVLQERLTELSGLKDAELVADKEAKKTSIGEAVRKKAEARQKVIYDLQHADGTWMLNSEAMTYDAKPTAQGAAEAAELAHKVWFNKNREYEALKQANGVNEAILNGEERMFSLQQQQTEVAEQTVAEVERQVSAEELVLSEQQQSRYYSQLQDYGQQQGYIPQYGGAINTSGLATEHTLIDATNALRGIWELLNGGAPQGGWKSSAPGTSSFGKEETFASSLAGVINTYKKLDYEAAALIGKEGLIGDLHKGKSRSIDQSVFDNALAQCVREEVLALLHNHPDGWNALTLDDIKSGVFNANHRGVKVSGSVGDKAITSVDYSNIDDTVGKKLVSAYQARLDMLVESTPEWFKHDKKGNFAIRSAAAQLPGVADQMEILINGALRGALQEVERGDAFKQFKVSDMQGFMQSIIKPAQEQVAQNVLQAGAQAAVDGSKEINQELHGFKPNNKTISNTLSRIAKGSNLTQAEIVENYIKDGYVPNIDLLRHTQWLEHTDKTGAESRIDINWSQFKYAEYLQDYFKTHAQQTPVQQPVEPVPTQTASEAVQQTVPANPVDVPIEPKPITIDKDNIKAQISKLQTTLKSDEKYQVRKSANGKNYDPTSWLGKMQGGLLADYSKLSNANAKQPLRNVANGYFKLKDIVDSEIYNKLSEDTKNTIQQLIESARTVLNQQGVTFNDPSRMIGRVITDTLLPHLQGVPGTTPEVGKIISGVRNPILFRNNEVLRNAYVSAHKATSAEEKQLVIDTLGEEKAKELGIEKAITSEKKKRAQIQQPDTVAKTEQELATETALVQKKSEERDIAEGTLAAEQAQVDVTTPMAKVVDSSGIPQPTGGGIGAVGGLKGLLGGNNVWGQLLNVVAKDTTSQQILTALTNGVKSTGSGGKDDDGAEKKSLNLSADEALEKMIAQVNTDYPGAVRTGSLRANAKGYSVDFWRDSAQAQEEVKDIQEKINQLEADGKANTEAYNNLIQQRNSLLQKQEKITLSINKDTGNITSKVGIENFAVGANAAEKELQSVQGVLSQLQDANALQFSTDGSLTSQNQAINNWIQSMQALQVQRDKFASEGTLFDSKNQQVLSQMTAQTAQYRKEVMALLNVEGKFGGDIVDTFANPQALAGTSELNQKLIAIANTTGEVQMETVKFDTTTNTLSYTIRKNKNEVQDMTLHMDSLSGAVTQQAGQIRYVDTAWGKFGKSLKGKFQEVARYLMSFGSIYRVWGTLKQGVGYIKEIDTALTELKKVTDATDREYAQFLQTMSKTAGAVGSTTSELTKSASDWARLGFSMQQAGELAKSTAILMNVSEFDNVDTATEALISSLQAFNYTADDSIKIVDKLNIVGKIIAQTI
jgi:hypothetical protein